MRVILLTILLAAAAPPIAAQQPPVKPADEGFLPVDQLPPEEKLPAAPLLIGAYAVAWVAIAGYLWSIWQRLGRVERDIAEATRRAQQSGRR